MGRFTTDSLVSIIDARISERVAPNSLKISSTGDSFRSLSQSIGGAGAGYSIDSGLLNIVEELRKTLPSRIIEGLDVYATDPPSNMVHITTGKGTVQGKFVKLVRAKLLEIPLDKAYIYYILLNEHGISLNQVERDDYVTLAKIVIKKPGVTTRIRDVQDDSWDGYIIVLQEYKLHGYKGILEEDSIELLRDNINPIISDNLIGNIRLSENLKILNTQGTLEMDSQAILIKNVNGNILSKFNREGAYFYDTSGRERARFTGDDARVGNILITKNTIQSENFISGYLGSGFQIRDNGNAEFNNVLVRGKLSASVFEKATVSVIGGNLLILDGDILDEDMTSLDNSTLTISGDTSFAVGDRLRIKIGTEDEWFEVTDISNAPTYVVTRDKDSQYIANNNPDWKKGTAVTNFGQSGQGGIYLTASESYAPYINVFTHSGSPWSAITTHVRIGNLNGFLDYVTNKYGIGIGTADQYLKYDPVNGLRIKGNITVIGGNATITFHQDSAPVADMKEGDLWMDSDDGDKLYRYESSSWVEVQDDAIATAQATADSKARTFFQTTAPIVGMSTGDLWVDIDDNNTIYTYQGGNWVEAQEIGIKTFRQSVIPTAEHVGDLWIDTDNDKLYRATNVGDDEITAGEWELQNAALATGGMDINGNVITKILPGTNIGTPAGAGLFLGADYLGYYSGSEWKVFIDNSGNFTFKGDGTNYLSWNGSALTIRGQLIADDIKTGTLDASLVSVSSGDGKMTITGNVLTIRDASDITQVILGKYNGVDYGLSAGAGNIIINNDGVTVQDAGQWMSSLINLRLGSSIYFYDWLDNFSAYLYGEQGYLRTSGMFQAKHLRAYGLSGVNGSDGKLELRRTIGAIGTITLSATNGEFAFDSNVNVGSNYLKGDYLACKYAYISSFLDFSKLSVAPTKAEGKIYVGTDNHIYCCLNNIWKQLDN